MAKFTTQSKAMLQILKEEQIHEIHENALAILENTGVRFESEKALHFLEEKGCNVDYTSRMVKFPRKLVIQAIESAPESFDMYNCAGEKTLELGKGRSYFAPGPGNPAIIQKNGEKRPGKISDLQDALKIAQKSKYLDLASGSIVPDDCPDKFTDIRILYEAMKLTNKTILAEAWEEESVDLVCKMIEAVHPDKKEMMEKPFLMLAACPAPPMKWEERVINTTYKCMEYGIPVFICASPIMGVSAPVTIAGGILQHTVENLSYLTFMQLYCPGTPVFYGGICGTMDMRTTYSSESSVEACMCTAGYACMAQYYSIPSLAFLAQTDAKVPDYQAGFETSMGAFTCMLSGIDVIYGAGVLDSYNCTSNEKLMMDGQLFGSIKMFAEGIQVDEETLGREEIEEVVCGDEESHMQREFTVEWYRESQFMTENTIDRVGYTMWKNNGKDILTRADQAIENVVQSSIPLDSKLEERIEAAYADICKK